jgi:hypothetical protein
LMEGPPEGIGGWVFESKELAEASFSASTVRLTRHKLSSIFTSLAPSVSEEPSTRTGLDPSPHFSDPPGINSTSARTPVDICSLTYVGGECPQIVFFYLFDHNIQRGRRKSRIRTGGLSMATGTERGFHLPPCFCFRPVLSCSFTCGSSCMFLSRVFVHKSLSTRKDQSAQRSCERERRCRHLLSLSHDIWTD